MGSESDGVAVSRLLLGADTLFTNDDCGVCACEVDGRPRRWSVEESPGCPGDILEFDRGTYLHYAVKTDEENVIHMTGDGPVRWKDIASSASENAIIKEESFCKVARGSLKVRVYNKYDDEYRPYAAEKVVKRARGNLGRRGYHLLFLNCEHFSNWCRYGISLSHQVELLGTTVAAAVGGAGLGFFAGPIGAAVGLLGGILLSTGTSYLKHRREYQKVHELKRSISNAQMPSVILSTHNIQTGQNGRHRHQTADTTLSNGHQ